MSLKPWVDALRNPPIQYQKGWTEFYKLKFKLTPDVLIPRPETELLVDEVLKLAPEALERKQKEKIDPKKKLGVSALEIGTGSGCIAISIVKNLKDVGVVATDISEKAVEIARKNADFNHVSIKNLVIIQNDLYEKFTMPPDIIVANLPYIPTAKLLLIDPMVRDFEPMLALDGGSDGFELYRKLFAQIRESKLFPKYLICEIDEDQADLARQEVQRYFPEAELEIKKDLAKKDRVLVVRF